jgi:hypothetical protein
MIFTRHIGRNGSVFGVDSITNSQGSIMNKYVAGSGVGATSSFARRAKLYRSVTKNIPQTLPSDNLRPVVLNTIAVYLRNYMTEFRNTHFWGYTMDGGEGDTNAKINDGGNDMFDGGMIITPWLISGERYDLGSSSISNYPDHILYDTTTETLVDTNCKYISLGYIPEDDTDEQQIDQSLHPLTVICYRVSGPVGWQNGGNAGADGDGEEIHGYIYENVNVNGFTVYAGYRQIYDAGDPTICQIVILLGHSSWGSVFGPVNIISGTDTNSCQFVMYSGDGTQNVLAINTLLSKDPQYTNNEPIPTSELQTVVFNFTKRIKEACI